MLVGNSWHYNLGLWMHPGCVCLHTEISECALIDNECFSILKKKSTEDLA